MKIQEIIQQPEGRRLEFKQELPTVSDLAKTIVAFANDAGGDLYIGIRNEPREVVGIPEDSLMVVEEQISNIIYDQCSPVIIPEISIHGIDELRFIKVQIYRGSNFPYFLKSKGKLAGTYIRVGSSNRQADADIIAELERQKRNISFDNELIYDKAIGDFNIAPFKTFFKEKTGEELDDNILKKLNLISMQHDRLLPTNAYALFSENTSENNYFAYAKIECARFKGTSSDEFIDQLSITGNIALQAESAYLFISRHINKSAVVNGVYTESRWEYPIVAIREAIRNAVVHRDYSLTGKDIKVAIYDDMVEITSPGKLPPSIDFNDLEARQSDIRNKIIAPIFKKIGVIDQWGNGLKIIADELKKYPEISFKWFEKGLQFQIQFIKTNHASNVAQVSSLDSIGLIIANSLGLSWQQVGTKLALSRHQVGTKSAPSWHQVLKLLEMTTTPSGIQELMTLLNWKDRSKFRKKYIATLQETGILEMTIPDKPQSSNQQYFLSEKGLTFLNSLKEKLQKN